MRSIPVISPNVIRQCIRWHEETPPLEIRSGATFRFPDGRQQGTLYLHYILDQVMKEHNLQHFGETSQYAFLYSLQNCFCSDIVVVDLMMQPGDDEFIVTLSCMIWSHDRE